MMQMFVLDPDPLESAKALADVHIRVIGREIAMCLSSWYAQHMGHQEKLPYKAFKHPVAEQFDNRATRTWAILNADRIFSEFYRRFGKIHASHAKLEEVFLYRLQYDVVLDYRSVLSEMRFSYIEKGAGIIRDLPIDDAVKRYRDYYRRKLAVMKTPVVYTATTKPEWLGEL